MIERIALGPSINSHVRAYRLDFNSLFSIKCMSDLMFLCYPNSLRAKVKEAKGVGRAESEAKRETFRGEEIIPPSLFMAFISSAHCRHSRPPCVYHLKLHSRDFICNIGFASTEKPSSLICFGENSWRPKNLSYAT